MIRHPARAHAATLSLLLLLFVLLSLPRLGYHGLAMDEGSLLAYPDLMLRRGWVVHRDFLSFYGPGNLWLLASVYSIFGASVFVERIVAIAYGLAIVAAVYALAQSWGRLVAVVCALIGVAVVVSMTPEAFAEMGATALALWSAWFATRNGRSARAKVSPNWLISGLLAGLAVDYRLEFAPVVLVVGLLVSMPISRKRLGSFLIGVLLGLIPLGYHLAVASPAAVFQSVFVDGVLRASPSRRLPVPPQAASVDGALFWLVLASIIAALAATLITWWHSGGHRRNRREQSFRPLLAISVLSLGLFPEALARLDLVHLHFAAMVSLVFLPATAVTLGEIPRPRFLSTRVRIVGIVAIAVAMLAATQYDLRPIVGDMLRRSEIARFQPNFVSHAGRSFPMASADEVDQVSATLADVDRVTSRGERLFVGPGNLRRTNYGDTFLYFLLPDLVPASYYLEMEPGTAARPGSRFASDIASADVLILDLQWDDLREPNATQVDGTDQAARVAASFCPVSAHGPYRVLKRCPIN